MAHSHLTDPANILSNNPLLKPFHGVHGTPPFSAIRIEDYAPAFEQAIADARSEVQAIVDNSAPATFANTIEALEFSGARLEEIRSIFFNLNEANTCDAMQQLGLELSPKLTEFSNDISLNEILFARVRKVYENRDRENLTPEQARLLEKTYKGFTRNGAALSESDKATYRQWTAELSQLTLQFGQNVLGATHAYHLHLTDPAQLEGLPAYAVEGAAAEARERGLEGWVITLQAPSMIPFMTYSPNRALKEQLWRAYNTRCYGGEFDNRDHIRRITELRLQLANLLGYPTYADYVLEERMAENPTTVYDFLQQLQGKAINAARADVRSVQDYARSQGADYELMPWDFGYWSEKLKEERFQLSEEMTKPYFELGAAQRGIFLLAEKLYGLTFQENSDIEVYHPDVKAFEVHDHDGKFMAVLYLDYFPRTSKRGGAWMTEFRGESIRDGQEIRPLVSVVTNFTKPTENLPSLLTFNEVTTLLHEFGHALHGILAEGRYPSLTGTSVYWDFVELPSQLMENWATEKDFLDLWAAHYQTGEPIPDDLVQKIKNAENYLAAYSHVRQLSFGLTDMAWHSITTPVTEDPIAFERRATQTVQVLPLVDGQCTSTAFSHIFAGGYAAGYYSYKWAEVLEADAFSLFREKGIFNREVARSFRENILSKGDSEHPMTLYIRFRGHKPDVQALFDKMGIR